LQRLGYISEEESETLSAIRHHNPLMFDFVLKRTLKIDGQRFGPQPFMTRDFFTISA
jgi:hypothetical protein